MKELEENSIDVLVGDSPYGLAFMGKDWDDFTPKEYQEFSYQWGKQALRVLKPGSWLLNFSGPRTYHRMTCGLEDAGFKISSMIVFLYGAGFNKGLDISKGIDKYYGVETERKIKGIGNRHGGGNYDYMGRTTGKPTRKVIGKKITPSGQEYPSQELDDNNIATNFMRSKGIITEPYTKEAREWDGWYTQLKPGVEPIVLAQKPREGTFAENVLKWGVGGLNIEDCRIKVISKKDKDSMKVGFNFKGKQHITYQKTKYIEGYDYNKNLPDGRYPSNVILYHHPECKVIGYKEVGSGKVKHNQEITRKGLGNHGAIFRDSNTGFDVNKCQGLSNYGVETVLAYDCHPDCPIRLLDEQSGELGNSARKNLQGKDYKSKGMFKGGQFNLQHDDKGGASRFFYSGKAHKTERHKGCEKLYWRTEPKLKLISKKEFDLLPEDEKINGNPIATLKPINLMRYLVRLVCPKGGIVLDPFAGSGTTGIACLIEGMKYVLIEKRKDFVEKVIPLRLNYWKNPDNWSVLKDHNALPKLKKLKSKKQNIDILSFSKGD